MPANHICPSCGKTNISIFYEVNQAPVHSVLLLSTREEALNHPKGDVSLGFCHSCGFITNTAFNPNLLEYSGRYEATQGFSSTFNTYHQSLAKQLIERYNLRHKDIIEIGCGQGEFLTLLCELGENRGIGFDPIYQSERSPDSPAQLTFIKDFYSEKYAHHHSDFICCKMTLEHIQSTANFVRTVRQSIGSQFDPVVFFQVPDVIRILREMAFWDIYYEHCSYFSPGTLARLFRRCGFEVVDLAKDYNDQYLIIAAKPNHNEYESRPLEQEDSLESLSQDVNSFAENCKRNLDNWRQKLQSIKANDQRAVIWGAGSKGVAFLTVLQVRDEIKYAVDVNPYKHNTFMAGTGQKIISPEFLSEYKPDVIIVMNSIYRDEIKLDLEKMGLTAELLLL